MVWTCARHRWTGAAAAKVKCRLASVPATVLSTSATRFAAGASHEVRSVR